jgi:hypothetical protein
MDPNETLRKLREWVKDPTKQPGAELFEALDEWLTRGGFPPDDWTGEFRTHSGEIGQTAGPGAILSNPKLNASPKPTGPRFPWPWWSWDES